MGWWRKNTELDAEIESHIRMAVAERVERGQDAGQARLEVEREFGNTALVKDVTREGWGWVWLERLVQDVKYALRQLHKSPAFAVTVIATLALGIAAPTAMFTVVDRVMLRSLPYRDLDRLVQQVGYEGVSNSVALTPYLDLKEWRNWSKSFDQIGFYAGFNGRNYLEGKSGTEIVGAYNVSANLFPLLGVVPAIGRDFRMETDGFARSKDATSVVLSDSTWRSMFGGDPSVLGKTVKISGVPYVVVGVMPQGFSFPFDQTTPQIWAFAQLGEKDAGRTDDTPNYRVVAKLKPGVDIQHAQAELKTLQVQVAKGYVDPDARKVHSTVGLEGYEDSLIESNMKHALLMLLAASAVLWLIACVNTTNLLLARAMARQREVAVRGALGAGRWRIIQQFVVEGLLLSSCGSVIGLGLALLAIKVFAYGIKRHVPMVVPVIPNISIVFVVMGLTVVSALVSSIWPAWIAAHAPVEPALRQGGLQSGSARRHNRLRSGLVVIQIALSLTLLVGCGLLLRTIYALRHVPLGFRTDHIIVANLQIPSYKFKGLSLTDNLYAPLLERVRHLPGVQAAGLMSEVPLGKTFQVMLTLKADETHGTGKDMVARLGAASPELQKVFGFKMLAGRYFNEEDTPSSQPVLIVNRAFAKNYLAGDLDYRKVIGTDFWHISNGKPAKIIGVLDDLKQQAVADPSQPEVQASIGQVTPESGIYQPLETIAMDIALRTNRFPQAVIPELREVLRQADPALAGGSNFTTMDQVVEDSYGSQQLAAHLLEIFAGSALLLCATGLYGLLAYVVSQRTRELGVRLALGAQRGDLLWLVMRQASVMLAVGVSIGLGLAIASGRLVRSYLFGVKAHDGWTLGFVAATLIVIGMLAAYLPARRAANVDPMEALRME